MYELTWALSRRVLIFALCTFLLSLQTTTLSFAQGTRPEQAAWGNRGQSAINRLGTRLPEVAARYNMTPDQLARTFRTDFNLWIDKSDKLVYLDEYVAPAGNVSGSGTTGAGPVPYDQTFLLHSLPGATKVIYLDFNGHTSSGTLWNTNFNGGADIVSTPFDMDNTPGSFSNTELDRIQYIWQRVAEEYAPFGVDVTTQDPGVEGLRNTGTGDTAWGIRVVISPTNSFYPNAGGVAYIGSFSWNSDTPCFVFSSMLGPNSEKYVADATAHEVGHTLGLNHDGKTDGTAYYQGHPGWAPIMGAGYYQSLVQWSKGEYALANNLQDDLAIMTSSYGITYRNDDHSNTTSGATPLTVNGTSVTGRGIIERTTDVDYLSFQTGAGTISFSITGNPRDPNLDIQAKLFDGNGTQIIVSNPTGLSASFSTTLAAGTYYLAIDGVGTGDLTTGYSDYGSLGEFNISGTVVSTTTNQTPVAAAAGTPTSGIAALAVNFSSAGSTDADGSIASYAWNFGNGNTSTVANPSVVYNSAGTFTATLTVTDNNGSTSSKSVTITVTAPPPSAPTTLMGTAASSSQVNLSWVDTASSETGFKIERSLNSSTWTQIATVGANITAFSNTGLTANTLYYYRVRATNASGDSAYSNVASATTQAAASATMHIGDIDHTKSTAKNGTWGTTLTITVHKSGEANLANATVTGTWSNGTTGTVTCKTSNKGTCTISKTGLASATTGVTFTVTNVTASGYSYAATSNHDPDGSSNGTAVTIVK